MQYESKINSGSRLMGSTVSAAVEPRRLAVPDQLDCLHNSLETLGGQLANLRDRLSGVLSHERPQAVTSESNKTSQGCSVADAIHNASAKIGALSEVVDDLMQRLQV